MLGERQAAIMATLATLHAEVSALAALRAELSAQDVRSERLAMRSQALERRSAVQEQRSEALEQRSAALEAFLRRGPLRRLGDDLAAVWRAVLPRSIRAPLHRWRQGRHRQSR